MSRTKCDTDATADAAALVARRFHSLDVAKAHAARLSQRWGQAVVLYSPDRRATDNCCCYWVERGDGGIVRSWERVVGVFSDGREDGVDRDA